MEKVWHTESCVAKTDIRLLRGNMLTKERVFVLKTYYATCLYCRVKGAFHTKFPNSVTTLDFLILRLVRKFEEAGSVQDKLWKGRSHTATTTDRVKEVCELVTQNISSICFNDFVYIY